MKGLDTKNNVKVNEPILTAVPAIRSSGNLELFSVGKVPAVCHGQLSRLELFVFARGANASCILVCVSPRPVSPLESRSKAQKFSASFQQPLVVIDQTVYSVPEQTSCKGVERNYMPSIEERMFCRTQECLLGSSCTWCLSDADVISCRCGSTTRAGMPLPPS